MNTKKIRKITAIVSVFLLVISLLACTKPVEPETVTETAQTETTQEPTTEDNESYRITIIDAGTTIEPGATIRFKVTPIMTSGISWSVTGNSSQDTYIDQDGTLFLAKDEQAKTMIISAVSKIILTI